MEPSLSCSPADVALEQPQSLADSDLPLLAARWLAEGWDSGPLCVELASMTRSEAHQDARRRLPAVLESLGFAVSDEWQASGLDRLTSLVDWAVRVMDGPFTPYSAAQKVLEAVDDEPQTFNEAPGLDASATAMGYVENSSEEFTEHRQEQVRSLLLELSEQLGVGRQGPPPHGNRR